MQPTPKNVKVSAYNQPPHVEKRKQGRISRAAKGLDRSASIRVQSLRPVHFQVTKIKNGRIATRSFRLVGAAGDQSVDRLRAFVARNLQNTQAVTFRKYRLKLATLTQEQILPPTFKLYPSYRLRRQRQLTARRVGGAIHHRRFISNLLYSRRLALRLRTAYAPCVAATPRYRRYWQKR